MHMVKSGKGSTYSTKCGQTVYFNHERSVWHSDVTCKECLS